MSDLKTKLQSARTKLFRRTSLRLDSQNNHTTASLPDITDGRSQSIAPNAPPSAAISNSTSRLSGGPREVTLDTTNIPELHLHSTHQVHQQDNSSQQAPKSASANPPGTEDSPELFIQAPTPPSAKPLLASKTTTAHHQPSSFSTPDSWPISPTVPSPTQTPQSQSNNPAIATPESSISPPSQQTRRQKPIASADYFGQSASEIIQKTMSPQKVWIKRAGASPTLVQIGPDDLVDDVRDKVLQKYANSLGRTFDAPDVSVRIIPREKSQQDRILNPEEPIATIIEAYFPGGQTVEEALLVDVPRRRTPLPSPRVMNNAGGYFEDTRPLENGPGYFPPMPPATSPHPSQSAASHEGNPHSIAILETGQLPVLPSPREKRTLHRPRYSRHHTSSPTIIASSAHTGNNAQAPTSRPQYTRADADPRRSIHGPPAPATVPTPPAAEGPSKTMSTKATTPPLERINSPRITKSKKPRKSQGIDAGEPAINGRKESLAHPQIPFSFLEATIPPINVLIVEDNVINLRLLEAFTRKLKVRWQTAMNGREAVNKWRVGGFHLVLMDIQLPIMSGLEATKEIRRLERLNGIGVFAKSQQEEEVATAVSPPQNGPGLKKSEDEKPEADEVLGDGSVFKSPVIIVALTASSLQSDRHEALAAGCNDFLTKPVHFPWLERKVKEWGCMQALIDFDGWRKWKDLAAAADEEKKREEDLDPELKAKREQKEAKRAQLLARIGGSSS